MATAKKMAMCDDDDLRPSLNPRMLHLQNVTFEISWTQSIKQPISEIFIPYFYFI